MLLPRLDYYTQHQVMELSTMPVTSSLLFPHDCSYLLHTFIFNPIHEWQKNISRVNIVFKLEQFDLNDLELRTGTP